MQHEIQEHFLKHVPASTAANDKLLELSMQESVCRLCRQSLLTSKKYASHIAKHMESIALAALPQTAYDSDDLAESSDTDDGEEVAEKRTKIQGGVTYKCDLCERVFSEAVTLRMHIRMHVEHYFNQLNSPKKLSELGHGASVETQGVPRMGVDLVRGEHPSTLNTKPSGIRYPWEFPDSDQLVEPDSESQSAREWRSHQIALEALVDNWTDPRDPAYLSTLRDASNHLMAMRRLSVAMATSVTNDNP